MKRTIKHSLTDEELHQLAVYNAEVARGLVHTQEWQERMKVLQQKYDNRLPEI